MHAILDSHNSTTNRSRNLVVNFILYDLILTHTIVDILTIIILAAGLLFQIFILRNIHIYTVAIDKII